MVHKVVNIYTNL